MKLTKKLLPALGMLALSTCMMVTSTFAWFSMNTEVKASGMSVKAVGEQVYLQIINSATGSKFDDNAKLNEATTTQEEIAQLKPITVGTNFEGKTKTSFTTGDSVNAGTSAKWATNVSKTDDVTTGTDNYEVKASSDLEGYVFAETFKIRLNPGAGKTETTMNLDVKSVKLMDGSGTTALKNAVSVFVVLDGKGQLFTQNADGTAWTETGDTTLTVGGFANTGTNKDEGVTVTVYVFFDGEHEDCTSQNLWDANKDGAINKYTVEVLFALV